MRDPTKATISKLTSYMKIKTNMIRRLVQKEQVSIIQHSSGEFELHLPSSRQATNNLSLAFIVKSDLKKLLPDLFPRDTFQSRVYI